MSGVKKEYVMNLFDLVAVGVFVVTVLVTLVMQKISPDDLSWVTRPWEMVLACIGVLCSLYLLIRFPWQCIAWFALCSIGKVIYVSIRSRRA